MGVEKPDEPEEVLVTTCRRLLHPNKEDLRSVGAENKFHLRSDFA